MEEPLLEKGGDPHSARQDGGTAWSLAPDDTVAGGEKQWHVRGGERRAPIDGDVIQNSPSSVHKEHTGRNGCPSSRFSRRTCGLWILSVTFGTLGPLSAVFEAHDIVVFGLNVLALIPLALLLADVVEVLAHLAGDTFGGLLSVTMSNLVELVIAVLAIRKGYLRFVQVTLLGSVLTGSLLLPGVSFVARGLVRLQREKFNKPSVTMNSLLLLLAAMSVALPNAYNETTSERRRWECMGKSRRLRYCTVPHVISLSRFIAVVLLACYLVMLVWSTLTHSYLLKKKVKESKKGAALPVRLAVQVPSVRTATDLTLVPRDGSVEIVPEYHYEEIRFEDAQVQEALLLVEGRHLSHQDTMEVGRCSALMLAAGLTCWLALCAEFLLQAVDGAAELLHLTRHFVALVLIPNIGNVDAVAVSISMALKGKMDLALTMALGSAVQVSLGLVPLLVLLCWWADLPLDLDLHGYETVVLMISALVVNAVVRTAKSTYLEGILMIGGYLIIACSYALRSNEDEAFGQSTCVCGTSCCNGGGSV